MSKDLDPLDALTGEKYEDPTGEPITDPGHPDYVAPAKGIKPISQEGGTK